VNPLPRFDADIATRLGCFDEGTTNVRAETSMTVDGERNDKNENATPNHGKSPRFG